MLGNAWNPSVRCQPLGRRPARCGIIKSKIFVDTKVWGHGWNRRNSINNALFDSLAIFTISARCKGGKFVQNNVVCNAVFLFTSCAQNVLALWHVQALTIGQVRRIIVLRHRIWSSMSVSSHGRACPLVHKLFISSR